MWWTMLAQWWTSQEKSRRKKGGQGCKWDSNGGDWVVTVWMLS